MSFDALTVTGMFLLLLFLVLVLYICNRVGMTCNDRSRHTDEGERELARRKRS
jgi:Na+-transporting methylmalonyl-CoA/oxaloacetate decarboxylase gamma subunit